MTTCDQKITAALQVELCSGLKHTRRAPHWSRPIDWPHGPRQYAQTRPSLPWTERLRIAKYYARGLVTRDPRRLEKRSVRSPPWGRHATGFTSHEMRLATITVKIQRPHLPWMESLA